MLPARQRPSRSAVRRLPARIDGDALDAAVGRRSWTAAPIRPVRARRPRTARACGGAAKADAPHTQRDHAAYPPGRQAHYIVIVIVKGTMARSPHETRSHASSGACAIRVSTRLRPTLDWDLGTART